jgi:hypothetical protein
VRIRRAVCAVRHPDVDAVAPRARRGGKTGVSYVPNRFKVRGAPAEIQCFELETREAITTNMIEAALRLAAISYIA